MKQVFIQYLPKSWWRGGQLAPFSDGPVKAHKTQGYFGKAVGLETRLLHDCSKQLLPLGTINYVIPGASLLSLLAYTDFKVSKAS